MIDQGPRAENPEKRQPKNIENVQDRFMDFIGNPLNGILGYLDSLQHEKLSDESRERMLSGLNNSWTNLFERLETFRNSGFEQVGNITMGNIDKLLTYKSRDPLEARTVEELDDLYHSIVDHV